jgi:two-component system sensor histidine kinase SenX3
VRRDTRIALLAEDLGRRPMPMQIHALSLGGQDVAVLAEDITEVERVESVRRDFVANVGHEIKTPVGAISLLAEAALDAVDDREAVHRFLQRLQHEAGRLSRLVQELIELSRLQGGEALPGRTPVRLDPVVDEAIDRVRAAADAKGITVDHGGERGLATVGSHTQLVTAVGNLLENAVAYSGAETRIAVGMRRRRDMAEIAVTDEGIGIPRGELDRIFERFYRADPARSRDTGGTGLGLAIVKHIVGNHGGDVSVASRVGSGTTFTIRLPLEPSHFVVPVIPAQEVTT